MNHKKIILADTMGYCWGVRRALDIIQEAGDPANPVATIGDVIHNPQVVERLRSHGVDTAASIAEAAQSSPCCAPCWSSVRSQVPLVN